MSAVVGHCINIESQLGVPTVPLIISQFHDPVQQNHVIQKGMPALRVTYLISPVWGKTVEQIRKDIVGKSPTSGKMVMQDIVDNLTRPLTPSTAGDATTGRPLRYAPAVRINPGASGEERG